MTTDPGEPRLPTAQDEQDFWALLDAAWAAADPRADQARRALAGRAPGTEPDAAAVDGALGLFLAALAARCAGLPGEDLTRLDRVLERKLHDIDRQAIHDVTDGSDDGFLYSRGYVVALGRDFYQAVVADPRLAIPDAECEEMCYFFAHQHQQQYGTFPRTGSGISRETGANRVGWHH